MPSINEQPCTIHTNETFYQVAVNHSPDFTSWQIYEEQASSEEEALAVVHARLLARGHVFNPDTSKVALSRVVNTTISEGWQFMPAIQPVWQGPAI